jgi:putative ATPase
VGKTTIARLLAKSAGLEFEQLSAIFSGVKELRTAFERAEGLRATGRGTLLFVVVLLPNWPSTLVPQA